MRIVPIFQYNRYVRGIENNFYYKVTILLDWGKNFEIYTTESPSGGFWGLCRQ
jgi:hypothetical protein